ncbi:zinc finger FYVE domain-containing protein 26 isoform X1 [Patella vulgata]|uniref:zinc finger FYVE domain-containing protein 26 isoform X1 n=1 Tax=Patella vulgata TaxID=6465 RepID=UPI00218099F4|nr:zinc finger FYVE domain-containing protein 26 isoform X1 [Patella vulgata]
MATGPNIKLTDGEATPAQVDGSSDVFTCPNFILLKARWVSDDEVSICVLCGSKFNQIRRKHHCRHCGRVLCNKCCKDKIALPQLGIDEKERVCDWCKPIAELVSMSRSSSSALKLEAAKVLSGFCKIEKYLNQIVQLGGIQTLVSLSLDESKQTMWHVMEGLQILSTYPPLHRLLVEVGAIKAICSIISRTNDPDSPVLSSAITTLMVFCKSPELRTKALDDGVLDVILKLCSSQKSEINLLAVSTLNLIVTQTDTHTAIVDSQKHALPKILYLTVSEDELMQEVALKILGHLSCGTAWHKHRIVQEDFSAGRCLQIVLNSRPNNVQILCNAACVVANLATSSDDQDGLQELMISVCHLLQSDVCTPESDLLCHISRGIANFARFAENGSRLLGTIEYIMEKCIKSQRACIRQTGMRVILQLLTYNPSDAVINMIREPQYFLRSIIQEPELLTSLLNSLQQIIPDIVQPK